MVLSDFCEKIKISRCRWPGYCSIAHREVFTNIIIVLLLATPLAAGGHAHRENRGHLGGAGRHAVLQRASTRYRPSGSSRPFRSFHSRPIRSVPSSPSPRVHHRWSCPDGALILHMSPTSGGCLLFRWRWVRTPIIELRTGIHSATITNLRT